MVITVTVISPLRRTFTYTTCLNSRWRWRGPTGDMIIVRYADDVVVGFEYARRFWDEMPSGWTSSRCCYIRRKPAGSILAAMRRTDTRGSRSRQPSFVHIRAERAFKRYS